MRRTLVLLAALVVVGAGVAVVVDRQADAPGETIRAVADRDADHALRAEVRVTTDGPTDVTVVVAGEDGHGFRVGPERPVDGEASVPLLGLRPGSAYAVTVESGGDVVDAGTVRTRSLPEGLPPVELETATGPAAEGVTLLETLYAPPEDEEGLDDEGAVFAVDGEGEIVWYERQRLGNLDVTPTSEGRLLVTYHEMGVREIDPATGMTAEWMGRSGEDARDDSGREVATSDAVFVDTDQMHHEVLELDNGNLLTLSREIREVTYPQDTCDEAPAGEPQEVAADTLVEFERDSGEVVREFSLWDVLDPLEDLERVQPSQFCSPYLEPRYPQGDVRDWTHANGIEIDEERNVVWISARHLDELVGLRWQDDEQGDAGELVYRLGEGGDFDLVGDGEWFLHQHAPELQEDGSILLYDNGNWREGTSVDDPENLPYSRAVQYELDTASMTVEQVWEHRFPAEDGIFAPYVGDADRLPSGNVLIAHGGLLDPVANSPSAPGVQRWARIVEVDPSTDEIVYDLVAKDPDGETGWGIYRAERLPHLYPPGWTLAPL